MSKKRPATAYLSLFMGILSLMVFSVPLLPQLLQLLAIFFGWCSLKAPDYHPNQFKKSWLGWAGFFMGCLGLGVWIMSSLLSGLGFLPRF